MGMGVVGFPLPFLRNPNLGLDSRIIRTRAMASDENLTDKSTKLITFIGKGGSGKTTTAILAAQHYAMAGLNTCLVIHSQDPTAEYLLDCKIGTSPIKCSDNFSAVRLETTKMLLEPLNQLKKADARLNMTQGFLEGVVGEELGVLPGMDSIFSALALERFVGFLGIASRKGKQKEKFDVVIYDGISSEETLRMIGVTSRARLYLKYMRNMAEKTDIGRLAGPSVLRLTDEAMGVTGARSPLDGTTSGDIWDTLEQYLERGSAAFSDRNKFGCYLVMDPNSNISINSALRYWGCALQADAPVYGAFGIGSLTDTVASKITPMPFAVIPHISMDSPLHWDAILKNTLSGDARNLLSASASQSGTRISPVMFDATKKTVTLFMPGFDKSEIKLYQYRGGSELLVEAGDQRRVITLPAEIRGKVGGAKFIDRSLVITMR